VARETQRGRRNHFFQKILCSDIFFFIEICGHSLLPTGPAQFDFSCYQLALKGKLILQLLEKKT
jgi:hypothetical protein